MTLKVKATYIVDEIFVFFIPGNRCIIHIQNQIKNILFQIIILLSGQEA